MKMNGAERFDWSYRTRPIAEQIISTALPMVKSTEWTYDDMATRDLDREHGIDLVARLKNGQPLTFQVKVLNSDYHTVTVEAENSWDGKPGDWTSDLSQYLLCIYSDDGHSAKRWALIDQGRMRLAQYTRNLTWRRADNTLSGANSKFRYLPFAELAELAPETVVMFGGNWQLGDAQVEDRRVN